jgi:putative methionine-R-sulfoxide reductase with GAF domain
MSSERPSAAGNGRQGRGSSGQRADEGFARNLGDLARRMQADHEPASLLQQIVEAAVTAVPGTAYAGITLLESGDLSTPAKTDELVAQIDKIQYELGEGPCVQSSRKHETVRSDDMRVEQRWPQFAAHCVAAGVFSMVSVQLFVESESFGALNLYATETFAFDNDGESIALLLAAHAAVAMAALRNKTNFDVALASRDLIGQAKGILMERFKINANDAFGLLILASQHANRKLRDVAGELVSTGELNLR